MNALRGTDALQTDFLPFSLVWCRDRLTSIDSINFSSSYFLLGSANGRHQIESRGWEKRKVRMYISLVLWKNIAGMWA